MHETLDGKLWDAGYKLPSWERRTKLSNSEEPLCHFMLPFHLGGHVIKSCYIVECLKMQFPISAVSLGNMKQRAHPVEPQFCHLSNGDEDILSTCGNLWKAKRQSGRLCCALQMLLGMWSLLASLVISMCSPSNSLPIQHTFFFPWSKCQAQLDRSSKLVKFKFSQQSLTSGGWEKTLK